MINDLSKISLFKGCTSEEIDTFIRITPCRQTFFRKGALLIKQGFHMNQTGILLKGKLKAFHISSSGDECIHNILGAGSMFGYVLMSSSNDVSPVSIEAIQDSEVLFVPLSAILNNTGRCAEIIRLNLLHELSNRCRILSEKVDLLSKRSIRSRIAGYILQISNEQSTDSVTIPISRESLANLLCVNRSALSRELSKMRSDKLIDFNRNTFYIRNHHALSLCYDNNDQ